jgi:hypothetical protein
MSIRIGDCEHRAALRRRRELADHRMPKYVDHWRHRDAIMIMAIFAATLSSWISQVTTTDCGLRIVKVPVAGPPLVEL